MKNALTAFLLLLSAAAYKPSMAATITYHVKAGDIYRGYVTEQVWLDNYARPSVAISAIGYEQGVSLPKDAKTGDPRHFIVSLGMDRKKPFAIINIPVFVAVQGAVNQVSDFTLTITEQPAVSKTVAAKTTDVTTSALASGTWYKMAITRDGFYKIDYNFIKNILGVNPSTVNPANIRICGNGGHMLSEQNAVARPADLIENAIQVNGNGDNVFDDGESAVFYGIGPTQWTLDPIAKLYHHTKNLYSDTAYYFISFDSGPGLRISTQTTVPAGNMTVSTFDYYDVHDSDMVNPAQMGKNWYGEQFLPQLGNSTQQFNFDLGSAPAGDSVHLTISFASTADIVGNAISVYLNGGYVGSSVFSKATPSGGDDVMALLQGDWHASCTSQLAGVGITFFPVDGTGTGYLNYIEVNAKRFLAMTGDQLTFRELGAVEDGNIAIYQLQNANGNTVVWDITNPQVPVIMKGTLSNTTYTFNQDAGTLHEFAAMNSLNLYTPAFAGNVPNQNLHGSGQVDLIIVSYPAFDSQAHRLADFHRSHDNMRVIEATTSQVYNEFSSGGQDLSAIRDFARMFYKRAGTDESQMPRYLILFGGASYDYKNRLTNNSNFVPVFESSESLNDLNGFSTDDFYGFLDDSEYIENDQLSNIMDVGVGRLPARSAADATILVNKIVGYNDTSTLGPWRVSTTIVADKGCDDPAGDHMADAEGMAQTVAISGNNLYNQEKVYVDAIPIISTPAGDRSPNANAILDEQVFKGTFLINYNGHGNPTVWSAERILTEDDYNKWTNKNFLPFMVTATCDFGQFDHPQFVSSAEKLVLRKDGGVIVILTTTQAVYAYYNHELNSQFLAAQFQRNADSSWNSFGEASRRGKNLTYGKSLPHDSGEIANFRKFSLLGDPALVPDFPKYIVKLDQIVDDVTGAATDSLQALGAYTLKGSVRDWSGNVMPDFNGMASVSIFDKPENVTTISGCNTTFTVQNNTIYKGRVSVTNGQFQLSFITPKDINYNFGQGKVSSYAQNGATDAAGQDISPIVGGYSPHPKISTTPPVVKPYINDSLFLNGGITGSNTSLFVTFYSETGINVSGKDVGHDLTAILDDNNESPYILNDYYETAANTYQYGYVSFPISGLADGRHRITVKAWDVNDNVGTGTVDFMVIDGKVTDVQQLMNYPNPFSQSTHFVFEHNHPNEQLNASIEIYSTSGALVKKINQSLMPADSRTNEITWDGTDNNGSPLPSGVYVYRLILTDVSTSSRTTAYQKLVIVR